jgi:hypothetical protein
MEANSCEWADGAGGGIEPAKDFNGLAASGTLFHSIESLGFFAAMSHRLWNVDPHEGCTRAFYTVKIATLTAEGNYCRNWDPSAHAIKSGQSDAHRLFFVMREPRPRRSPGRFSWPN